MTDPDIDPDTDDTVPAAPPPPTPEVADHDPLGVDLARLVARGARGGPPKRRSTPKSPRLPVDPTFSGARPDRRDPQPLSVALERVLEERGLSTGVNLHVLLGRWESLVGEVNAQHSRPEGYADGVLVVRTDSTVWATSLRAIAPVLLARLNESLGQGSVTRIDVQGPVGPSWKKGRRSVRDGRGPRDTYG